MGIAKMSGYTFHKLATQIGEKTKKKIGHNTEAKFSGGDIVVTYHGNPIVILSPDGSLEISTCGWNTVTTTGRLHAFVVQNFHGKNIGVSGAKGTWLVNWANGTKIDISSGEWFPIDAHGNIGTKGE